MFAILFSQANAKTVIENPPITIYTPSVSSSTVTKKTVSTTSDIRSLLTGLGVDTTSAKNFANKMQYSTKAASSFNSVHFQISTSTPSRRTAKSTNVVVQCTKSGGKYVVSYGTVTGTVSVDSQVIETNSKTFLWWEWDKQVEIRWRPLTQSELNSIYNKLSSYTSSKVITLAKSVKSA